MKKNVKALYEAPVVELLEARVEKGFAGSATTGPSIEDDIISSDLENVTNGGEYGDNGNFVGK